MCRARVLQVSDMGGTLRRQAPRRPLCEMAARWLQDAARAGAGPEAGLGVRTAFKLLYIVQLC